MLFRSDALAGRASSYVDRPVILGLRPEDLHDAATLPASDPARTAEMKIEISEPMGAETYLHLATAAGTSCIARVRATHRFEPGQRLRVSFDLARAHLFDRATEKAI